MDEFERELVGKVLDQLVRNYSDWIDLYTKEDDKLLVAHWVLENYAMGFLDCWRLVETDDPSEVRLGPSEIYEIRKMVCERYQAIEKRRWA